MESLGIGDDLEFGNIRFINNSKNISNIHESFI